jgi:hypothetical protein
MSNLNKEEKEVILDFYFRCGDQERINGGRDLIAGNPEAAQLYANLEDSLRQLDSVKYEPCPENLAELTVAKLKLAASSEQARLESLLAAEQRKTAQMETTPVTTTRSFWQNVVEVAAIAAVVLVVAGVSFPSLSRIRETAVCKANLMQIGRAIAGYANDNDGLLPSVAMTAGSPWWKVGDQGEKNQSNTRHVWLLVKKGYLDGKKFACPGRKDARAVSYTQAQLANLNDFPSRQHINYSFTFISGKISQSQKGRRSVLLGDLNPVFEKVFEQGNRVSLPDKPTMIFLEGQLLNVMSANHAGRGQNILFGDGSCEFKETRNIFGDDIFTVRNAQSYSGCEVPCDEDDIFLAP